MKNDLVFSEIMDSKFAFGGLLLKNANARCCRPLSKSKYLHLVLHSKFCEENKQNGLSLLKRKKYLSTLIKSDLKKYGIRIHKLRINQQHIQIMISLKSKKKYFRWIRRITGLIARHMLKAEKGNPSKNIFWSHRPFTNLVSKGRQFWQIQRYLKRKLVLPLGFISIPTADDFSSA